ncbi:MAG TPA: hypothetical protein VLE53_13185 [Gemmatimonadaceae bacterium]|nr:hypothetical protein [Gemmatimonadaceae bacterium]
MPEAREPRDGAGPRAVTAPSREGQVAGSGAAGWTRLTFGLARRAIISPRLARDLLLVLWRFRRRRWFARPPFLPLPAREYVRWRMYTAYGDENAVPPVDDMIRYARWAGGSR